MDKLIATKILAEWKATFGFDGAAWIEKYALPGAPDPYPDDDRWAFIGARDELPRLGLIIGDNLCIVKLEESDERYALGALPLAGGDRRIDAPADDGRHRWNFLFGGEWIVVEAEPPPLGTESRGKVFAEALIDRLSPR